MLCPAARVIRRANGVARSYRQSSLPYVRNVREKAAGRTAAGGASGSTLAAGKFCGHFAFYAASTVLTKGYVLDFNIDASLTADIIPRGWEVRQAWQTRLSVSNKQVQSFRKAAALGPWQAWERGIRGLARRGVHGGFWPTAHAAAAALTLVQPSIRRGWFFGHVSKYENRFYHRRSRQDLQS